MLLKKNMNKVISLMGPTASGKTDLAISLSEKFNLEIISVDSVMVYKELNIGSSKPDLETLLNFPHRLVNIIEPHEQYSVAQFYNDLLDNFKDIYLSNKVPLLVGGSMMYFKTFFSGGLSELEPVSANIKNNISNKLEKNGLAHMYNHLVEKDKEIASKIHPHDKYRIIRMLEIFYANNKKPSDLLKKPLTTMQNLNNLNLSIIPGDRNFLHSSIKLRLKHMIKSGFIDEVEEIRNKYVNLDLPSMSTIGYKQVNEYLNGKIEKNTMEDNILAATRQLAKRQITWLRHLDGSTVYTFLDYDNIENRVKYFLSV